MPVSQDEFRNALSRFASGITVVSTVDAAGRLHGITVSAFCSVSLDPPMVLICIEKCTASHFAFEESKAFVVNILDESQSSLSEQFAAPFTDKFGDVEFQSGIDDIPVLIGSLASLECRLTFAYDGGDHSIFVGVVERATIRGGKPLIHFEGEYRKMAN